MAGMWKKTLVYLGLAEEDEEYDDYYEDDQPEQRDQRRPVRRVPDNEPRNRRDAVVRPMPTQPAARVHFVHPSGFRDDMASYERVAQDVGDHFRDGWIVHLNLQGVDAELRKKLLFFAQGLAYGLDGRMDPRAGDNAFLMLPRGVEVSAEEKHLLEERGFLYQA